MVDKQYQDLLRNIKVNGIKKNIRAGEVKSIFGTNLRFNLREGFPLLTTKKMYVKGILVELLWFLNYKSVGTNIGFLVKNGVNIWNDDAYRHYLDVCRINNHKVVLSKEDFIGKIQTNDEPDPYLYIGGSKSTYHLGDLGPVYGKQWRDWGGIDQVENVIHNLRNNPDNTRLIINAWNVSDLKDMALPPCHMMAQFYTRELSKEEKLKNPGKERELSCMWIQRSVDSFLGLPYNIASYAFLTHMIAHVTNMAVGDLIFNGGDTHIYLNQMDAVEELLSNDPHKYKMPTLELNSEIKELSDFTFDDFKIINYKSYPTIKAPLSVGL